jgi:hypothetical protein
MSKRLLACEPQNGGRANDQQSSNVWVALFGDAARAFFPATRMLSRNEAEPRGKLAAGGEDACVSYRCSDCPRNDWADPGDRLKAAIYVRRWPDARP